MPRLIRSLQAWGTHAFESTLKAELMALGTELLPLEQGLRTGSVALSDKLGVMVLDAGETPSEIRVRAGIFFTSIIAGCACADDPTPVNENAEYVEVDLRIDRLSGEAWVTPA